MRTAHFSSIRMEINPCKTLDSAVAGLIFCWSQLLEQTLLEWEQWLDLVTVGMIAKHSTLLTELTRTNGSERMPALKGGLAERAASNKDHHFLLPVRQGCVQ